MPNALNRVSVHARVDKREQGALRITYRQGTVWSRGQFPGRSDDPLQCCVEIKVCADLDDHTQQLLHLIARREQLIELLMHPAHQPMLAESVKRRADFVAGHLTRYLHDSVSPWQLARCVEEVCHRATRRCFCPA